MTGDGQRAIVSTNDGAAVAERPVLVASFTKLWVAIATLRAVARQELSLDDEIRALLPTLKSKPWADSTVRELLGHTSRVPEFDSELYSRASVDFSDPATVLGRELSAATEKRGVWKYRNAEYALLGAILQARAARPVAEVLAREVFEPAGMKHAGILIGRPPEGLDLSPMGAVRPQNFFTAGNGYASPDDLLAFFEALDADKLLDVRSRALLFEGDPKHNQAALGCWAYPFVVGDGGATLLVERPGSFGNVRLFTAFFPEKHRAILLWSKAPLDVGRPRSGASLAAKLARAALE